MMQAGVIGYPIEHSKSPLIHNYWLEMYGISAKYDKYVVSDIDDFMKNKIYDFVGVNVTVPYKTAVMPYMTHLTPAAVKAGAVNTITNKNGVLTGDNTDGIGFIQNVLSSCEGFKFENAIVTLLGTGGAARGVAGALVDQVSEIRLVYRTEQKAQDIKSALGNKIKLIPWAEKEGILPTTDLLINATTLGMNGFDDLKIDLSVLKSNASVADLVYSPLKTTLLQNAIKYNHSVANGLGMLLQQARPAFYQFFGTMPEITSDLCRLVQG